MESKQKRDREKSKVHTNQNQQKTIKDRRRKMYVNIKRNIKEDTHKTDKKVRGEKRKKTESDRE